MKHFVEVKSSLIMIHQALRQTPINNCGAKQFYCPWFATVQEWKIKYSYYFHYRYDISQYRLLSVVFWEKFISLKMVNGVL